MAEISEMEVQRRLDPNRVIAALEDAFRRRYPNTLMPVRTQMQLADGILLIMPAYDRDGGGLGMKLIIVSSQRADVEGKIHATYLLLDPQTGKPKLQIAATHITEIRTAAASALATKYLAREDVKVLGIFGTGRQARSHLKVLRLVRNFEHFLVSGLDPGQSREFAEQMAQELGVKIESVYSRACAAESDVLCTCTTSKVPLFDGHLIRRGTHINAIGAFQPDTREVDDVTVQRARVVVDTYEGALAEAGDLLIPMNKGIINRSHILADLHEVINGRKPARTGPDDITLFKSVGNALEDLVAAELLQAEDS